MASLIKKEITLKDILSRYWLWKVQWLYINYIEGEILKHLKETFG